MDTYSSLKNRGIVSSVDGTGMIEVEAHFFQNAMRYLLENIYVDEKWYVFRYPDVIEGINSGKVISAAEHYIKFGYFEDRMPYKIEVIENWYLEQYPDIKNAVFGDLFESGQHHFEVVGFKEGRLPFSNFSLRRLNQIQSHKERKRA